MWGKDMGMIETARRADGDSQSARGLAHSTTLRAIRKS